MLAGTLPLFFALAIGHALADYPLQGDFLAKAKNHTAPIPGVPWYQALFAHALIQAGMVWALTGRLEFALLELVCHVAIDRTKCDGAISYNVDQLLHLLCKALWVFLIQRGF